MSAYCVFDVKKVIDNSKMEQYRNSVMPIVAHYGGKYVAAGGPLIMVEGSPDITFPVIIEFPNLEKAKQWYESSEYKPIKKIREQAAETFAYFIEGI